MDQPRPAFKYAPFGKRFLAYVVDLCAVIAFLLPILIIGTIMGLNSIAADPSGSYFLLSLILTWLVAFAARFTYYLLTMLRPDHNGQTWGKQMMGLKVQTVDGRRVSKNDIFRREMLARNGIELVGTITFYLLTILSYMWPLWDKKQQTLHDKLARTIVVEEEPSQVYLAPSATPVWEQQETEVREPVRVPLH